MLIKSTRLVGKPLVLERARPSAPVAAAVVSAVSDVVEPVMPASIVAPVVGEAKTSTAVAMPAMDAETLRQEIQNELRDELRKEFEASTARSYDEYKKRFQEELDKLAAEARAEGLEKGSAEGKAEARKEYDKRVAEVAGLIAGMRKALDDGIDGISELGIDVVHEAVTKIIGESMTHKDAVIAAVREVIRHAKERSKLVVRISPADWKLLEDHRDELMQGFHIGAIDIVADDHIQAGGCIVETPSGNLDARLEIQLQRLREVLIAARAADEVGIE